MVFVLLESVLPATPLLYTPRLDGATESPPSTGTTGLPPTTGVTVLVTGEKSPTVPGAVPGTGRETLVEWWNTNYDYRRKVTVVEPDIADRVMEPVNAYLTFTGDTAREGIMAVAYWDLAVWHEVPSQIWNATTHTTGGTKYYNACTVLFLVNVTRNYQEVFYVYYDDNYATPRTYTDHINAVAANGPTTDDSRMPWVYSYVTSTNYTSVDTIYIRTSASSYESAAILLTDMIRAGSDWGGPCCGLITARYGAVDALSTTNGTTNREFMLLGEFALDPTGADPGMGSSSATRANVAPDNPAEAWVKGAGVWILDDGPLFTRIKIVTSDGGYSNINSPWSNATTDTVNRGDNGAVGFLNYTIVYTFYWHGNSTYVNLQLTIQPNSQWTGTQCNVKNYGDWPHVMTLTCGTGSPGTVDGVENRKAWYGTLRGLFNDSADGRRHDFPLEPWVAWYDDSAQPGYDGTANPSIGLVAKTNPVGWEDVSLVVGGVGDNLMLQQILREGHQGDFFVMPKGAHFVYDYRVYTSAYGTKYTEARSMAAKINAPASTSIGETEFYRHNVLTCYTKDVINANITDVNVYLYNSSSSLVRSGTTTGAAASVLFDKLEDDTYTIVSNYTLTSAYAGVVTFRVNSTLISLSHATQRGWSRAIKCQLSKLSVKVVNWYDGSVLPADAEVRLTNATGGRPIYAFNASRPSGTASAYLLPNAYNVSIRYLEALHICNQTTPLVVSGSSYKSATIGVVVTECSAELLLMEPTQFTYVEVYQEDVVDFVVFYHDIQHDVGINVAATSIPHTASWVVSNSTHPSLDSGQPAQVPGELGNYSITFDASRYELGGIYELRITMDANAPVDYWQVILTIRIRIIAVRTSISISQPPPFPIEAYGNITIYYFDLDHIGVNWGVNTIDGYIANNSGGLRIACNVTSYTVYARIDSFGHPYYQLRIDTNSPKFNRIGFFLININVTWEGSPYYGSHFNQQVIIQLRGKDTLAQTTIPESVPFGDDVTFVLTYWDVDLGTGIGNSSGNVHVTITASGVPGFGRGSWVIAAVPGQLGNYSVAIHTTGFPGLGSYLFSIDITWPPSASPHYESQETTVRASVRAIRTDLNYTSPTNVYWSQNTSVPLFYNDTDHGNLAVTGATVTVTLNGVPLVNGVNMTITGRYLLTIFTYTTDVGLQTVTIIASRTLYESRTIVIAFYVNPLPLTVTPTVADPIELTWGGNFWVEVYVETVLGAPLVGAKVTFSWTGGTALNTTGPGGYYGVWFDTRLANVGVHYVTILVNKTNHAITTTSITLSVLRVGSRINTVPPDVYNRQAIVGQDVTITVKYTTYPGGDNVTGANVTYVLATLSGQFVAVTPGIYQVSIDTSGLGPGLYTIYVSASSTNVDSKAVNIALVLTLIPSSLEPTTSVVNVYYGDNFTLRVYYNDTFNNIPIDGATITYFWETLIGTLQPTGTPGWYNISLRSDIATIGVYELRLFVDHEGYQSAAVFVTINLLAQPTRLTVIQVTAHYEPKGFVKVLTTTPWEIPQGDILWLNFTFTDDLNNTITGAIGYYTWAAGSGQLEFISGYYIAKLNLTEVTPGLYTISVTLSRQNYQTALMTHLQMNLIHVPTEITGILGTLSWFAGEPHTITVFFNDTYHNELIAGASLTLSVPGTSLANLPLRDNGDGSYTIAGLSIGIENGYTIEIHAVGSPRYQTAYREVNLLVSLHPLIRNAAYLGAAAALIGVLILGGWLAYSRVFSIPWLVRKMRGMSKTLGKGKTPSLSGRDRHKIVTRPDQMSSVLQAAYDGANIPFATTAIPVPIAVEERDTEDKAIWHELDELSGLGHDQKLELFEQMKRIPAKDRIWFLEDLKKQMKDGTRFGRPAAPKKVPKPADDAQIMHRLDAIPTLNAEEKAALLKQIRGLPPDEREEVFKTLQEQSKQAKE